MEPVTFETMLWQLLLIILLTLIAFVPKYRKSIWIGVAIGGVIGFIIAMVGYVDELMQSPELNWIFVGKTALIGGFLSILIAFFKQSKKSI